MPKAQTYTNFVSFSVEKLDSQVRKWTEGFEFPKPVQVLCLEEQNIPGVQQGVCRGKLKNCQMAFVFLGSSSWLLKCFHSQFQQVCTEYETYGNVGEAEKDEVDSFIRDIKVRKIINLIDNQSVRLWRVFLLPFSAEALELHLH